MFLGTATCCISAALGTRVSLALSRGVGLTLVAFLLGSLAAQPVRACPLTTDAFTYADGSNLDGQGGGDISNGASFTSDWEVVGSTPVDAFTIDNGKVVVGDTDGSEFRVERGVDFSGAIGLGCPPGFQDPTCSASAISEEDTYFVATEMTQVQDNHAAYEIAVEFSDAEGLTMAFGIENNGVDEEISPGVFDHSDYFFATLGDTRIVSTVTSNPNEPAYVYSVLNMDDSFEGEERLRIWINPDFQDVLDGVNPDIDISRDLESIDGVTGDRSVLGETVALVATTDEEDRIKTFDDVQVFRDIELLQVPRLDIGNGNIQTAFEEWTVGAVPDTDFELQFQQQDYMPSIDPTLVTLSVEALALATDVTPFAETFVTEGVADDLRGDGLGADGGIRLTFSNLHTDWYYVKSFHYQTTDNTEVEVFISVDGGVTFYEAGSFIPAGGDERAHEYMISFATNFNGGADVVVEYRPTVEGATVSLSGLQFVPEPGTGLLLAFGLLGLASMRRRARR